MTIKLVSCDKSHQFHSLSADQYFWVVWLGLGAGCSPRHVMIRDDPCLKSPTKSGTKLRVWIENIEMHWIWNQITEIILKGVSMMAMTRSYWPVLFLFWLLILIWSFMFYLTKQGMNIEMFLITAIWLARKILVIYLGKAGARQNLW